MRDHAPLKTVLTLSLLCASIGLVPQEALASPSLTLNPPTIAGGSGAYSTATITLDAPAPAGGVTVTLTSSNTDLAATAPSVTVPQGARTKTFRVWTNGLYRRYSELGFTATISGAVPGGGTASATLTVTAQAMPPDILGPDSDMDGLNCGGESPDVDVLMSCADGAIPAIPGPCHKQQECTLGCQDLLDNFTTLRAECSTTPPFPFLLSPKYVQGGAGVAGSVRLPSGATAGTTASAFFASIFATAAPGSFSIPTNATTASFAVTTEPTSVSVFAPLTGFITVPEATPSGGTFYATRSALAWLAIVPAPGTPEVDLSSLTLNPTTVTECESTQATVTLTTPAPTKVQVFLESEDLNVVDVPLDLPRSVVVQPGQTNVTFPVGTRSVSGTTKVVDVTASLTGVESIASLTVTPAQAPALQNITLTPNNVVAGDSSVGRVFVDAAAPAGGAVVNLTSGNPAVVQVPPSVTVPQGQTSATFPVTTSAPGGTVVGVTASRGCISLQTTILVGGTPSLWALSVNPTSVAGGAAATGNVQLTATAPASGIVVGLSSSNPSVASVPASVTIASDFQANFPITTSAVTSNTSVTITATQGSVTRTTQLTVTAPQPPTITSTPVTAGALGQPYSYQAIATGTPPIAWSMVSGPAGMAINSSGLVTWTPSALGSFPVQIRAANSVGSTTQSYTITVSAATDTGLRSPAANAPESGGDGNGFESSPANAQADDAAFAADNNSGTGTGTSCTSSGKDRHRFYNYGLAVPAGATVQGIEVRLDSSVDSTFGSPKMCVQLSWDGGTTWTAAKSTATLGTTMASRTLGGATDTWGRAWSAAHLSDPSFRVRIINVASSTSRDFLLDWVAVRAYFGSAAPAALSSVSLNPSTLVGGSSSTGTVTLTSAAPSGGAVVSLTSSDTGVATVPASVTVTAGATSASFTVNTVAVAANNTITITGSYSGVTRSATLTVTPPAPSGSLSSLTLNPATVRGGDDSIGTVTLSAPAPSGGAVVNLSSSNSSNASVPSSVTIPAGSTSRTFTITTDRVGSSTTVTITATRSGVTKTAVLTITSGR